MIYVRPDARIARISIFFCLGAVQGTALFGYI